MNSMATSLPNSSLISLSTWDDGMAVKHGVEETKVFIKALYLKEASHACPSFSFHYEVPSRGECRCVE